MNSYPIIANKQFQDHLIAEVNTALENGVTAAQLADFLEYHTIRQLRDLAGLQMKAAIAEQQAETEAEAKREAEGKENAAAGDHPG